jgi:GT2 family glycosyltransferase
MFLDVSNLTRLIRYVPLLRESYLRTSSHTRVRLVLWVLGAAVAIRRKAFEAVGGFDESFFIYHEEVDLCYRLAGTGWEVYFAPITDIVHVGGASTQQQRADMSIQFFVSLVRFYRRHYSRIRLGELVMLVQCLALARLVRDRLSLLLTRDPQKRSSLAENVDAWQRLLFGDWRREMTRG